VGGVNFSVTVGEETPTARDETLIRMEPDGELDARFVSGVQIGSHGYASAPAVLPDGGILVGVRATSGAPLFRMNNPPLLSVSLSGGSVTLSWPESATDFVLEATAELSSLADWQPVPDAPVILNGKSSVTLPANQSSRFFRLRRQP
jgi:hypothetical protein